MDNKFYFMEKIQPCTCFEGKQKSMVDIINVFKLFRA